MSPRAEANDGVRGPPMSAERATRRKTESGRARADRNEGKSERLPGERESKEDGYNVRRVSKRVVGGDRARARASLPRRRSQRTVFGPRPTSETERTIEGEARKREQPCPRVLVSRLERSAQPLRQRAAR
ncbi:hypothetical protein ALC57_15220 [Trachymyrmex cornetzi]|uniref:Uncharacterized protein n=1 Tax=Trachymyrmex cornetzi TaxID=471704 RepID=A0A195DHW9_9HYME|nr:hypothetical protein ALC57_15220 [Trachymyrmex cornetzi]